MSSHDEDSEQWANYEDFAAGIDTNRLTQSKRLDGSELKIESGHGTITLNLGADAVKWSWKDKPGEQGELSGQSVKDVVEVAPDTYFIDLWLDSWSQRDALTAIVGRKTGRTLTVHTHIRDHEIDGVPLVEQTFEPGTLAGANVSGSAPEETRELIGKRGFSVYSHNHGYEHIYLSSERYSWQCLNGFQRGNGDTDMASYWRFADNQYIFTFREFRISVASVMFLNVTQGHSTGKFLGLQGDDSIKNGKSGATFRILSETQYPTGYEPV